MPFKHETHHLKLPRDKDRRVKLTAEQRQEIRENAKGLSNREMALEYGVSRRLIQFIRDPEKQRENLLLRQQRGGSKIYYDPEKHREAMKGTRTYKQKLYKAGELLCH